VSLWIEMHIAASLLLQSFKVQVSKQLRFSLYLIWPLGMLLGLCSTFTAPWTYDSVKNSCEPAGRADPFVIADLALCTCFCTVSYFTVVCRSRKRHSPGSVQLRASARAEDYMINALLTYCLTFVCYVRPGLFEHRFVTTVAWITELLGGLFNTVTYAFQSRYAAALMGESTLVGSSPNTRCGPSFTVDFVHDATSFEIERDQRGLTRTSLSGHLFFLTFSSALTTRVSVGLG